MGEYNGKYRLFESRIKALDTVGFDWTFNHCNRSSGSNDKDEDKDEEESEEEDKDEIEDDKEDDERAWWASKSYSNV